MTILSRNLSNGSRLDEYTAAAIDLNGLRQPQVSRTQTSHSPGWTMMTVDKSVMKDISRLVAPFIDELDLTVNAKINGVMRHLSSNIETISSRVDQLAARVNSVAPPPPKRQFDQFPEKPIQTKPSGAEINIHMPQTTRPKPSIAKAFERRPGLAPSMLIPTQAVVSPQPATIKQKRADPAEAPEKWQAVSHNKYFIQRNQRKMSNIAANSSKSIPEAKKIDFAAFQVSSGDMKASEQQDSLQMKRKMSSNRLREKREEVLMKRRKSQGYMSRKSSVFSLQDDQQLERR